MNRRAPLLYIAHTYGPDAGSGGYTENLRMLLTFKYAV